MSSKVAAGSSKRPVSRPKGTSKGSSTPAAALVGIPEPQDDEESSSPLTSLSRIDHSSDEPAETGDDSTGSEDGSSGSEDGSSGSEDGSSSSDSSEDGSSGSEDDSTDSDDNPSKWLSEWKPTQITGLTTTNAEALEAFQTLEILRNTKHPTSAPHWLKLAKTYLVLGYPELAAFEAYRAILLSCRKYKQKLFKRGMESHRRNCQSAVDSIVDALNALGSSEDAKTTLETALKKIGLKMATGLRWKERIQRPRPSGRSSGSRESDEPDTWGRFRAQTYPWIKKGHRFRLETAQQVVADVNDENDSELGQPVQVKKSRLTKRQGAPRDMLGLFAKENFDEGDIIFEDTDPVVTGEVKHHFVSEQGDKKWKWLQQQVMVQREPLALGVSLILDVLIYATNDEGQEFGKYLENPRIAVLTADGARLSFTLQSSVINFMHGLETWCDGLYEVSDIWTGRDFGADCLFTLYGRVFVNMWRNPCVIPTKRGERDVDYLGLSRAVSMLNHSCRPNVDYAIMRDPDEPDEVDCVQLIALNRIREGDELYISFIERDDLEESVSHRRKELRFWFQECLCAKCVRERRNSDAETHDDNDTSVALPPLPKPNKRRRPQAESSFNGKRRRT